VLSASPNPIHEQYDRQSRIERGGRRWNQAGIADSRALVCGAGNIGASLAVALVQAGFQHVDVIDLDTVARANLSRGVVWRPSDVGQSKATALAAHLHDLNPEIHTTGIVADLRWDVGTASFRRYDLIFLATHDLSSRRHVNRYTHLYPGRSQAIIEGGIADLSFSLQTILVGETPCYDCGLSPSDKDGDVVVGCNGVASAVELPPAGTNGMDGMAVAALMAKEGALLRAGLEPFFAGRELRFEADLGTTQLLRPSWRRSCSAHLRAPLNQLLEFPYTNRTTVTDLCQAVAAQLGVDCEDVHIFSPLLIVAQLHCDCGQAIPVMRPQQASLRPVCPSCGNADGDRFYSEFVSELLTTSSASSLADYGIPNEQGLEVYVGADRYYLVPPLPAVGGSVDPASV